MSKAITFTDDIKSLIWSQFVQPAGGTAEEAKHFVEVCEEFGLNPLLGDIVFQRYETKNGPKVQFITTRDGLLRVASRQPGYVGPPNANVVKEGDHFEFLPSEGTVKHKFGAKRGNILGAYAIMRHAKHHPVAVFVDFEEYYNANSGKLNSRYGNANVWDKMPSAMIIKTAESFVLKRQFPLGGLYTQEEMGLDEDIGNANLAQPTYQPNVQGNQQATNTQQPQQPKQQDNNQPKSNEAAPKTQQIKGVLKSFETKTSASGKDYGLIDVLDEQSNNNLNILVREENAINILQNTQLESTVVLVVHKENGFIFLNELISTQSESSNESESNTQEPDNTPTNNVDESPVNQETTEETSNQDPVPEQDLDYEVMNGVLTGIRAGQKGQIKYVQMAFQKDDGNTLNLLAHGDQPVAEAQSIEENQPISIRVKHENGFNFFVGIDNEQDQQVG